jgi:hypothetical protein
MPASRILPALLAAAAGAAACAPVAVPIHFHHPSGSVAPNSGQAPGSPHQEEAVLGPLHVAARAGADFIEVRIRNTGAETVLVDWSGSSFISPTGRAHALVTSEWLMDGPGSRFMRRAGVPAADPGDMEWTASLWHPNVLATHLSPTPLHLDQQPFQRIGPGAVHVAVLFPAEHVVAGEFRMHTGASLLCDALPAATVPMGLALRWHDAAGWRISELAGTLPTTRAARKLAKSDH